MLEDLLKSVSTIYIAYSVTDFRKQITGLTNMVMNEFKMNPYQKVAYLFCNRKKNSIKVLVYDKTGFILAQKTLLDVNKMRFRWPRNEKELQSISKQQLSWLLSGLEIFSKKYFEEVEIGVENLPVNW